MARQLPTPPRRSAVRETTHARILDVARRHFERDGFDGASIRAIAAEAGVAAGTVLLHFADKKGLLHAALYEDLEQAIARCLAARTRGPLLTRLVAVTRQLYGYYAVRPTLSRVLLRESLFADEPWRARFAEQVARVMAHVAALADRAKADGELPDATDTQLLSVAFCSFYYLALIGWVQGGIGDPLALFKALMGQHLSTPQRQ